MDFRVLDLHRICFDRANDSKWKARYGGAGDVMFQLPTYRAVMERHPKLAGCHQLRGNPSQFTVFRDFIQGLKTQTSPVIGSKRYYDSFKSLALFETTLFFDSNDVHMPTMPSCGTYFVTPLVKLAGVWSSDHVWGYRLDVPQIKVHSKDGSAEMQIFIEGKRLQFLDDV